jgi:hypothetical protein
MTVILRRLRRAKLLMMPAVRSPESLVECSFRTSGLISRDFPPHVSWIPDVLEDFSSAVQMFSMLEAVQSVSRDFQFFQV